ncbi:MAG: hypothetical protein M0Z91_07380 [Actinomycetota bacterium]|jgi:hypothetical protein|nr:hypothetical protein [Actinomycetota bacterium]
MTRAARAFAMFWWDFLVGDTPELTIGILVALGAVYLFPKGSTLAGAVLYGVVVVTVALSLAIEARRVAKRSGRGG